MKSLTAHYLVGYHFSSRFLGHCLLAIETETKREKVCNNFCAVEVGTLKINLYSNKKSCFHENAIKSSFCSRNIPWRLLFSLKRDVQLLHEAEALKSLRIFITILSWYEISNLLFCAKNQDEGTVEKRMVGVKERSRNRTILGIFLCSSPSLFSFFTLKFYEYQSLTIMNTTQDNDQNISKNISTRKKRHLVFNQGQSPRPCILQCDVKLSFLVKYNSIEEKKIVTSGGSSDQSVSTPGNYF